MKTGIFRQPRAAFRAGLTALYILNMADIGFSCILLSMGGFQEMNPLMRPVVQNFAATVLVKLIIPAILIIYLDWQMKEAELRQIRLCGHIINALIAVYAAVNAVHILLLLKVWPI